MSPPHCPSFFIALSISFIYITCLCSNIPILLSPPVALVPWAIQTAFFVLCSFHTLLFSSPSASPLLPYWGFFTLHRTCTFEQHCQWCCFPSVAFHFFFCTVGLCSATIQNLYTTHGTFVQLAMKSCSTHGWKVRVGCPVPATRDDSEDHCVLSTKDCSINESTQALKHMDRVIQNPKKRAPVASQNGPWSKTKLYKKQFSKLSSVETTNCIGAT